MKKIVGILAAAAVFATSVFAADISAKVELDGNLFKYDGATKTVSALNVDKPTDQHWNAVFSASVSGDNAGASFVVLSGPIVSMGGWNSGHDLGGRNWQIWMSPVDGLKFTIGKIDANLNQEQITWSGTKLNVDSNGFGVGYSVAGFSFDLMFTPGLGTDWFTKADGVDAVIGETTFKAAYGADFGTIGLLYKANDSFKTNTIALGYSNNFGPVFAFLNAGVIIADKTDIRVEAFAKGNAGDFGWAVWLPFGYNGTTEDSTLGSIVELTYALGGTTAYVRFNDENFMADNFKSEIRLGAKGSVGGAGWNIWAQIDVAEKTSFSIPFEFGYSF
ncbi:MAG: hypothetical protein K6E97_07575 [Treponema sp.]|nr:hypothetical protein [Treponema sp.]